MWLWWRGRGCGLGISLLLVLGLVKFVLPFTTTSCLPALQQARTGCKYSPSMLSQQSRGFLASRSIRQENAMKLYLSSSGNSVERLGLNPPNYLLNYLKTATTKSSVKSSILISVADVVANTGKPFPTVRRDLLALAVSTGAGLQVTEEGELLFRFPINFSSILQQRSFRYRLKQSYGVVAPYVNQLVRASYGVGLIASLLIVTMAISGLSSSKHNDEDDSRHSNNRNHHRRHHHSHHNNGMSMQVYIDLNSVFNLIFARDHPNGDNMSLLDACYSFLFGDGDPNQSKRYNYTQLQTGTSFMNLFCV